MKAKAKKNLLSLLHFTLLVSVFLLTTIATLRFASREKAVWEEAGKPLLYPVAYQDSTGASKLGIRTEISQWRITRERPALQALSFRDLQAPGNCFYFSPQAIRAIEEKLNNLLEPKDAVRITARPLSEIDAIEYTVDFYNGDNVYSSRYRVNEEHQLTPIAYATLDKGSGFQAVAAGMLAALSYFLLFARKSW